MTSTGLQAEPFGGGTYPAVMACNLRRGKMKHIVNGVSKADKPSISHDQQDRFISNVKDGTWIAYKYFSFQKMQITVVARGTASGVLEIYADQTLLGTLRIQPSENWQEACTKISYDGIAALQFHYRGKGRLDFLSFTIGQDREEIEDGH